MQQVAEVKRTRIARTLFNELELRAEWVGQPLERRTLFEPAQQIVDQPVPLSHIFEQRVVEDVEANDLFDGWNDAVETRIDELSHAVAIVVLEEGSRFGVQPPLDGGVEGNLVDAGVIQGLLFFLGREEGVAQVVVGERVQLGGWPRRWLQQNRPDGRKADEHDCEWRRSPRSIRCRTGGELNSTSDPCTEAERRSSRA